MLPLMLAATATRADDWHQWRGPNRDGTAEAGAFHLWTGEGPKLLWAAKSGVGCSSVIVVGERVFALGTIGSAELDKEGKSQDELSCFDAASGKVLWRSVYDAGFDAFQDAGGPNSTPACDGKFVYSISKLGHAHCFDVEAGAVAWDRKLLSDNEIKNVRSFGGIASSPFVTAKTAVFLTGFGIGLDKNNGKTLWEIKPKGYGCGTGRWVSPVSAVLDGKPALMIPYVPAYGKHRMVFSEPDTGEAMREVVLGAGGPAGAAEGDPLLVDGKLFVSCRPSAKTGRGGSRLLPLDAIAPVTPATLKTPDPLPAALWQCVDDGSYWGNAVRWGDFIFSGEEHSFACYDVKTGAVKWREKSLSNSQPVVCDGKIILTTPSGSLLILDAGPEYKVLAEARKLLPPSRFTVTPALAGGRLYLKNVRGDIACIDVSGK